MDKRLRIAITIFAILAVLSLFKDIVIKTAIEIASPKIVGARIHMDWLGLGILSQKVYIKNLRMYNPPGFPDEVFLDMPEVTVKIDMGALLKGRMHLPYVVFNMDKTIIFRNKEGKLNVDSIKLVQEQMAANKGKPMKLPVFSIDVLKLNIGRVIVEDYTHAPPIEFSVYDLGIKDKTINNINGVPKLVAVVLVETLKPTAIRSAGMFAATTILGVGFLPALAVGIAIAPDEAKADFHCSIQRTHQEILKLIQDIGTFKKEDLQGTIFAKIYGSDISIKIEKKGFWDSSILIKARKYLLPKPETAGGILYQLQQRLK